MVFRLPSGRGSDGARFASAEGEPDGKTSTIKMRRAGDRKLVAKASARLDATATLSAMRILRIDAVRFLWVLGVGLAALALPGCSSVPAPSALTAAHWWTGRDFELGDRFVARGRFVEPPEQPSESISLGGLYAVPVDGDCRTGQRSGGAASGAPMQAGERADFWLVRSAQTTEILARVCGGQRVVGN